MSSIYLTEPPTQGKVLIKTTFGDIDVELWAKEAPLACRNFIQLSLEGYYDSTIVHRIVKGFMVQMGDPTGTGTGGKSIWGRPFKDEAHGRIKFNHRGQVAMANENAPNTNQSQFFITLDACEWLDRKHTIFGKVTGNTIFNVLRLGEVETGGEGGDRPLEELKIKGVEVLWNPFDDIVPRDLGKSKTDSSANNAQSDKSKNIKAVKDKKLLSFGDDEDQDGEDGATFSIKMKSSHDTKSKSKKSKSSASAEPSTAADSGLSRYGDSSSNSNVKSSTGAPSRAPAPATADNKNNNANSDGEDEDGEGGGGVNQAADFDRMMRSELIKKRQTELAAEFAKHNNNNNNRSFTGTNNNNGDDAVIMDHSGMEDALHDSKRSGALKDKSDTYKKLKEDLLRSRRAVSVMTGSDAVKLQEESAFKEMVSPLEQRRLKYMKRKSEHGDRSEETMEKLKKFTSGIRSTKQQLSSTTTEEESNGGNSVENYHGQVLEQDERDVDPEKEKRELQTWFVGKLKCKKHIDDNYRNKNGEGMSADGRYTDDYMVIDPLKQRGSSNNDRSGRN
eukprot:gene8584-10170_t